MNISKHSFTSININSAILQSLALSLTLFISNYCYAGIYKWVDEQGNVHYGQQRPADSQSERLNIQHHAPSDVSSYKRPGSKEENKDGNTENKDKAADANEEKKPETAEEKKRRLNACSQAKKNLSTMESIGRIKSKDKDGNASYLSQQQKEAKMKQSRDLISKHCK